VGIKNYNNIMRRKPNKVGGGYKTNINGLSFEGRTDLLESFKQNNIFKIQDNKILQNNIFVGEYYEKYNFYRLFLEPRGIDWRKINSKQYLPDSIFFNHKNYTVYVIEKKYQAGVGSVDEKLQTCDFKKKMYENLIIPLKMKTEYYYLLNDWFDKPVYKDVFSYIENVGCKYFINYIPLSQLGLNLK
tara:strand:+ start:217 stop:777 length:561 start_codon:yes stop_codon:yes gene_type:complete